jgi:hypothetical protein
MSRSVVLLAPVDLYKIVITKRAGSSIPHSKSSWWEEPLAMLRQRVIGIASGVWVVEGPLVLGCRAIAAFDQSDEFDGGC